MASPASKLATDEPVILDHGWPPGPHVVACAQRGDRDGQRRLYDACRERVFRLVDRMVREGDARDVSQQVFLQLFRNLGQFAGESRFETWLYRLTINECLQFRRQRSRKPSVSLDHDPVDQQPGHQRCTEDRDLLDAALARLDPDLRAVFLLRETEHLPYSEIAESLGISEGTVASRLNRARRRLQQILGELGWEP